MFKLKQKENLISLPQEKKQRKLLGLLVILILITLIILVFYFWPSSSKPSLPELASSSVVEGEIPIERIVEKIDFDINFLENSFFQSLKIYGEWPLEIGEKGRANPFLPY